MINLIKRLHFLLDLGGFVLMISSLILHLFVCDSQNGLGSASTPDTCGETLLSADVRHQWKCAGTWQRAPRRTITKKAAFWLKSHIPALSNIKDLFGSPVMLVQFQVSSCLLLRGSFNNHMQVSDVTMPLACIIKSAHDALEKGLMTLW